MAATFAHHRISYMTTNNRKGYKKTAQPPDFVIQKCYTKALDQAVPSVYISVLML